MFERWPFWRKTSQNNYIIAVDWVSRVKFTLVGQNKWDEQILVRAQSNIHKWSATPTNLMEIAQGGIFTFRLSTVAFLIGIVTVKLKAWFYKTPIWMHNCFVLWVSRYVTSLQLSFYFYKPKRIDFKMSFYWKLLSKYHQGN